MNDSDIRKAAHELRLRGFKKGKLLRLRDGSVFFTAHPDDLLEFAFMPTYNNECTGSICKFKWKTKYEPDCCFSCGYPEIITNKEE